MSTCAQPGCTGTVVDGYCDVCGMPPAAGGPVAPTGSARATATGASDGTACGRPGCTGHRGDHPAITMAKLVAHYATDNRAQNRGGCRRAILLPDLLVPADLLIHRVAHRLVYRGGV